MANTDDLLKALEPLLGALQGLDPDDAQAAKTLAARFPLSGPELSLVRRLVREGVEAKWLCERENGGVRFGRVAKDVKGFSLDAVHMQGPGAGHTHPQGEFDLCFAVSGAPRFDGQGEGFVVYGKNTWHVPTVEGGVMDILYFLPGGALRFEPKPAGATGVGLNA